MQQVTGCTGESALYMMLPNFEPFKLFKDLQHVFAEGIVLIFFLLMY